MNDQDRQDFEQVAREEWGWNPHALEREGGVYRAGLTEQRYRGYQAGRRKRDADNRELRNQIASLEAEIDRLNEEPDRLRLRIDEITNGVSSIAAKYGFGDFELADGVLIAVAAAECLRDEIERLREDLNEIRDERDSYAALGLRALSRHVATPEKGYVKDGGSRQMGSDIRRLGQKLKDLEATRGTGDLRGRFERWIKRTQGFTDDDLTRDNDGPYDRADVDEFWQAVQEFAGCGVDVDDQTPITAEGLERLGLENHRPAGCGFAVNILGRLEGIVVGTTMNGNREEWRWLRVSDKWGDARPIKTIGDVRRLAFGIDAELTEREVPVSPVIEWTQSSNTSGNTIHICKVDGQSYATVSPELRCNKVSFVVLRGGERCGDTSWLRLDMAKAAVERLIHEGAAK